MLFLLATLACNSTSELDAESALTLKAISGEEEDFAANGLSEPDGEDRPELFRPTCDPLGEFEERKAEYDADGSGELDESEKGECQRGESGPHDIERDHRMMMLGFVYDTDLDGELSEAEHAELFVDFEVRCEVLHAQVLEEFDADGDGELSDDELSTAMDAMEAERELRREEMDALREEMGGEMGPPEDGEHGERPEPGEGVPPFAESYDVDGELSDGELATLRDEARERIRNGEPPFEPPV
ncbi:MAG: hypothetical protein GY913_03330 [Proteobacteria bacterium]|nr:hypothetical protein [Pseudomonadota bacterium]MCP4915932.1 hypothetical protein [Pseudomonadota bacterium]